jgi:hypothetical protein
MDAPLEISTTIGASELVQWTIAVVQIICFIRVLAYFFQTDDERHIAMFSLSFTFVCGFGILLAFIAGWGPRALRRTIYFWLLAFLTQVAVAVVAIVVEY